MSESISVLQISSFVSCFDFFLYIFLAPKIFFIGVQRINNVVIVSGGQQRDSAVHICIHVLPQTPLPSRLPRDTEQSALCCPAGPRWFSMWNTAVCPCPSHTPWLSLPPSFPLVTIRLLQRIEQSSLCCPAGPCWLSILFWFFLVWLQGMWDLSSPTKGRTPVTCIGNVES